MKLIILSKGFVAKVDDEDYDWLSKFKWYAHKSVLSSRDVHYAARKRRRNEVENWRKNLHVIMHREIMKTSSDKDVDHIDGDGLNNQKLNLRNVSKTQNAQNAHARVSSKTGYRGVSFDAQTKHWRAIITVNKKSISLGRYLKIEDAIEARRLAEEKYFKI